MDYEKSVKQANGGCVPDRSKSHYCSFELFIVQACSNGLVVADTDLIFV